MRGRTQRCVVSSLAVLCVLTSAWAGALDDSTRPSQHTVKADLDTPLRPARPAHVVRSRPSSVEPAQIIAPRIACPGCGHCLDGWGRTARCPFCGAWLAPPPALRNMRFLKPLVRR